MGLKTFSHRVFVCLILISDTVLWMLIPQQDSSTPFRSFHPFVTFRLTRTVMATLKLSFFRKLLVFTPRCSPFVHCVCGVSHVECVTVLSLLRRQWKPTKCKWGRVYVGYISHLFCHFWGTLKLLLLVLLFLILVMARVEQSRSGRVFSPLSLYLQWLLCWSSVQAVPGGALLLILWLHVLKQRTCRLGKSLEVACDLQHWFHCGVEQVVIRIHGFCEILKQLSGKLRPLFK